jgi:hypothetical protein
MPAHAAGDVSPSAGLKSVSVRSRIIDVDHAAYPTARGLAGASQRKNTM